MQAHNTALRLLASARGWKLKFQRGKQPTFLKHIAKMTLRPVLVVISDSLRQIITLELTVPREDWLEGVHKHKRANYLEPVEDCGRYSVRPTGMPWTRAAGVDELSVSFH